MKLELNDTTFLLMGGAAIVLVGGYLCYKNFICPNGQWHSDIIKMFGNPAAKPVVNLPEAPMSQLQKLEVKNFDGTNIPVNEDNLKALVQHNVITEHQAASIYADEVYRRDGLLKDYKKFSFAALEQGVPVPRVF